MNAIELKQLEKDYPSFHLGPIDLAVPMGSVVGLVGENGAGKSTTLKMILDMVRPSAGSVIALGVPVSEAYPELKEDIGVVLDEPTLPAFLTATEIGKLLSKMFSRWDGEEYTRMLSKLALPTDKKFSDFSRGMRMKLSLAIALSHHARLLILDEATSGLDPMVRQEILELLYDFCDDSHAVLLSSHIVSDLERVCDYIAFLHKGQLLLMEEKDVLLEEYGRLNCDEAQLSELSADAVVAKRTHRFGIEVLVRRDRLPAGMTADRIPLEDLIILMAKEEEK